MSKNVLLWSSLLWLGPLSDISSPQTMPSPAAYWSFNTCDRGIVSDQSGGGNELILKNGARCASAVGRPSQAGLFDGVAALAETRENRLNLREKLTVSAWVRPDTVSGVQNIVSKWYAPDSYALALRGDRFVFTVAFPGGKWGTTVDVWSETTVETGRWSHVAGVFDGRAKQARLYVNGNAAGYSPTPPTRLQESTRPVTVGNHPERDPFKGLIDEVRLYAAALTHSQVRILAGDDRLYRFGADTNVHPELNQYPRYPRDSTYDFYVGHLGNSPERGKCKIQDEENGYRDVAGEDPERWQNCQFQLKPARIAGPERTYGYWLLRGPRESSGADPLDYGVTQAKDLIEQWTTYHRIAASGELLIGGRTLFGDVEASCSEEDKEAGMGSGECLEADRDVFGWGFCPGYEDQDPVPAPCQRNQRVLEGFLRTIRESGFTPGLYTSPYFWTNIFGKSYVPMRIATRKLPGGEVIEFLKPERFVLWTTGCESNGQRDPEEIEEVLLSVVESAMGGMKTAIWQYAPEPGYDATLADPVRGFTPIRALREYRECP